MEPLMGRFQIDDGQVQVTFGPRERPVAQHFLDVADMKEFRGDRQHACSATCLKPSVDPVPELDDW
jgi:hypothetical protein